MTGPHATPHPPMPGLLGHLAARAYGAAIARINRRYDRGRGVVTLDRPVISIGNLSTGGTGKTPMVLWTVRLLQAHGHRPAIAMRGYARSGPGGTSSDEARLFARALRACPVVAQPNRVDGLIDLFASPEGERVDAIVLDDGFQHRRLARDLDVVLLDATRDPFADRLLPAGHLREPVSSLARAHACVITHAEHAATGAVEGVRANALAINPGLVVGVARHEWTGLRVASTDGEEGQPAGWLRGKRVVAACAIGNPGPFLAAARDAAGGDLVGQLVLRDHDPFDAAAVGRLVALARRADAILVTEKDWSKLERVRAGAWPCAVARPVLELAFAEGREALASRILSVAGTRADDARDAGPG